MVKLKKLEKSVKNLFRLLLMILSLCFQISSEVSIAVGHQFTIFIELQRDNDKGSHLLDNQGRCLYKK